MSLLLAGLWLPLLFVSLLFLILIIFIYRNTIVPIFIYLGSIYYFPRNICIYILKIPFYFNRLIYPFAILPLYLKEVVKNKRVIPRISLNRWLFAFIIIQLLSIVVNIGNLQFSQGFSSINRFSSTFFECILVFYLTIFIINDEDKFKRMLNFIVISGGIISFYGLIELILRRNIIYDLAHYIGFREFNLGGTGPREGFARIRSFMLHPLELGCVLNMMLPFQYVKYIHSKGTSKMFYFLIILISTIAIIATVSRGAYLVLFIEMLLILILICRTRSVFIYLFYSVMFLMIFIFFNESLIKISNLFTPNYLSYDTSIKARLSDYPIIFAMLKRILFLDQD